MEAKEFIKNIVNETKLSDQDTFDQTNPEHIKCVVRAIATVEAYSIIIAKLPPEATKEYSRVKAEIKSSLLMVLTNDGKEYTEMTKIYDKHILDIIFRLMKMTE
jgi:hypothetical protein